MRTTWFKRAGSRPTRGWLRPWTTLLLFSLALPALGQTTISTVSAWDGSSAAYSFGLPNGVAHDTYGQTFTVPSGYPLITDINFRVGYNFGQGLTFTGYLMAWDGSEATGPVLFQSAPATVDSSTMGLAVYDFPITNVTLTPGNTYVFFLMATSDSGGAATAQFAVTGSSASYAGGNFVFTDSGGSPAQNLTNPWVQPDTASVYGDAVFAATFTSDLGPTATPTFSVATGIYTSTQTVTISEATAGASIYYTTTGTTPTIGSSLYGGAISVSSTETLKAIAVATGYSNSAVATAAYTITPTAAAPTFSVAAGTYTAAQTVTISDATAGAHIYYSTDGSTPPTNSSLYSGAITVSSTETLKAIAEATGYFNSAVATANYTIAITPPAASPQFSVAAGTYSSAQTVSISDTTSGASIYYTINGTTPTTGSSAYIGAITVSSTETLNAIAVASGYSTSAVATANYTITPSTTTSPGQWAWMNGSSMVGNNGGQSGVYGTLGTPAAGNTPGGRDSAASWIDGSGNFWLFGGQGFGSNSFYGYLNDLWQFNPATNLWVWKGGSSTVPGNGAGQPGVYGTLGTPAAGNVPGGRSGASSWIDSGGNLWLFGGTGFDASSVNGGLNDLWEFNPSTNKWAWISGSSTVGGTGGQPGVYGTLGTPAAGNVPGARYSASSWTDSSGHLWLFGGFGFDVTGNQSWLNDVWEFNPSTKLWTWMGGSSTIPPGPGNGQPGVYGTLGTFAAGNVPGARYLASGWTDSSGHFWLFGGVGFDASSVNGELNDLWEFNPSTNQWAWMSGSSTVGITDGQPGVYGTLGTPAAGNVPGGRSSASSWIDSGGNLWLFGGAGLDASDPPGILNDLWEFNPSTSLWAWAGGSSTDSQPGVYGTLGTPAGGNIPGGRV